MITRLIVCVALLAALKVHAQTQYAYSIDLTNVVDDRVKVTLKCPRIKETEAVFVMPNVIPGSYSWKEYGRFLSQVKAFDAEGKPLKITTKKNQFYLKKEADKLARLEYWVDDTWDDTDRNRFVFQPGGSNIEAGKNFVINHHAFLGYFEGYKNLPFEVEIIKPEEMYGATWLKKESLGSRRDIIRAETYNVLADNPVMYCKPDTASFEVDNTRIYVTSFSNRGIVKADSVRNWLKPMAFALKNFLGQLPVPEYHFIFYFASRDQLPKDTDGKGLSGYGALEHNHSSFYFLPEQTNSESVREMVQDVGSHEFLHILTPLNLHSREIADFDFKDPAMSQHLWLYEGVTEYFSWLVRVQNNLVTEEAFMNEMTGKLRRAGRFSPFSFTDMSRNVLLPENQENYLDVYQRGAVIAMMLDQLLLQQSHGKYSLKHLITDLMKKYGAQRAFDDEALFTEIVGLTYPAVADFIEHHIKGTSPLPIAEGMADFGYDYKPEQKINGYFIASFAYRLNDNSQFEIGEIRQDLIGLRTGDVLLAVNGTAVTPTNLEQMWDRYFQYNPYPYELTLKIQRNGREIIRTGKPVSGYVLKKHAFQKFVRLSTEQRALHDAWLIGKYLE